MSPPSAENRLRAFQTLNRPTDQTGTAINFFKQTPPAVLGILIVNVLLFVGTQIPGWADPMYDLLALHYPQGDQFHSWQFVTHMFMHGGLTHILFNMFGVLTFGIHLERIWGTRRFLIFYFIAGLGAAAIFTGINVHELNTFQSYLADQNVSPNSIHNFLTSEFYTNSRIPPLTHEESKTFYSIFNGSMLGASGALYGVLVAFTMLFPNAKLMILFLPVPIAAKYVVPALLLFDLFAGFTGFTLFGGNIAHFAHIGGAIIGFLLMLYWKKTLPTPRADW